MVAAAFRWWIVVVGIVMALCFTSTGLLLILSVPVFSPIVAVVFIIALVRPSTSVHSVTFKFLGFFSASVDSVTFKFLGFFLIPSYVCIQLYY